MLYYIGKINPEIYKCVSEEIITDEVIITEERIKHILERHPTNFEYINEYLSQVIAEPDYIIESGKANTAVVLKEISNNEKRIKLILRIKIENDPQEYKNSIISFWEIGETTWRKNIKNKKVLYKNV